MASLSTAVLRSGGSKAHPSAALDNALEELAAGIEGFALPEAIVFGELVTQFQRDRISIFTMGMQQ